MTTSRRPGGPHRLDSHRLDPHRLDHWVSRASHLLTSGVEPVLPVECAVCRQPAVALCTRCRRMLRRCTARPMRVEAFARHAGGLPVVAAGPYEHELATCILAFKQAGRTDLLPYLAPVLASCLRVAIGTAESAGHPHRSCSDGSAGIAAGWFRGDVQLVPVPTSARALRRRWFDPVALLLGACEGHPALPDHVRVVPWLEHRTRHPWHRASVLTPAAVLATAAQMVTGTPLSGGAQKSRSADERRRAGEETYLLAPGRRDSSGRRAAPGRVVLVDDDVVTTGATLAGARRTLEIAGATVLGAVVLAATDTPTGTRPR